MSPNLDAMSAHEELQAALADLAEYRPTPAVTHLLKWLDALIVLYQVDMLSCTPASFPTLQTALRQVRAMRDALVTGNGHGAIHPQQ